MGAILGAIKVVLVILAILGVILGVIFLILDGDLSKLTIFKEKAEERIGNPNKSTNKKQKEKKKENKSKVNILNSQDILDFDTIESTGGSHPTGIIVRNNQTDFIGIMEVKGINYNLLSSEERITLEEGFTRLINGLDFPVQIYIQSRKLDIDSYIALYKSRVDEIKKNIDNLNNRIETIQNSDIMSSKADDIILKRDRLIAQYKYGTELLEYIYGRCQMDGMIDRKYYIVVSYKHNSKLYNENLTYREKLSNALFDITKKLDTLSSSFSRIKLKCRILNAVDIAELLYTSYNRGDSENIKLRNALRSDFSHYVATAEPVEIKRAKYRLDELRQQAKIEEDKLTTIVAENGLYNANDIFLTKENKNIEEYDDDDIDDDTEEVEA